MQVIFHLSNQLRRTRRGASRARVFVQNLLVTQALGYTAGPPFRLSGRRRRSCRDAGAGGATRLALSKLERLILQRMESPQGHSIALPRGKSGTNRATVRGTQKEQGGP